MEPFEIIAAPYEVWLAPVGTAFPVINVAPAGTWTRLGTNGSRNISEDGVTITHEDEIEEFRMLGATGPIKAVRTSEGLSASFVLHDLTLEQYLHILNMNTMTTVPAGTGVAGHRHVNLYKGPTVATRAALIRGAGPYGANWNLQYELRRCYLRGEGEVVYQKGEPAGLEIGLVALVDAGAPAGQEFGILRAQHAAPL